MLRDDLRSWLLRGWVTQLWSLCPRMTDRLGVGDKTDSEGEMCSVEG